MSGLLDDVKNAARGFARDPVQATQDAAEDTGEGVWRLLTILGTALLAGLVFFSTLLPIFLSMGLQWIALGLVTLGVLLKGWGRAVRHMSDDPLERVAWAVVFVIALYLGFRALGVI